MNDAVGAVIVGVDGSEASGQAVRWAAELAGQRRLPLRIVHAYGLSARYYSGDATLAAELHEAVEQGSAELVAAAAEQARATALIADIGVATRDEAPTPVFIALSPDARMIVLGASGLGGFTGMLAGSTAMGTAASAACPVVVVRHPAGAAEPAAEGPVVVGVDGSPISERVIAVAFEEASARVAPLVAVHAWLDAEYESVFNRTHAFVTDDQRPLAERLAGWQEKYPDVQVEPVVVRERPRHQLIERSRAARLVVVGNRGCGGFTGSLLGSTSRALLRHAACPVLVVRP
ncbi:universal stress protein [Saccharomonospora sp. NPDC046836]|uniref:universal stress protein n=1 Tax=Saccharomonospora sp. NPDC046836 TaxID=3156921 RepID=UPI00340F4A1C